MMKVTGARHAAAPPFVPDLPILPDGPKVLAWRDYWLAHSETFIRDQVTGLSRWTAVRVGRRTYADPLLRPDYAPYTDNPALRAASRLPTPRLVRNTYRSLFADPQVKVVHAHFGPDGVSSMPFARAARKPLIVSFYGMDVTSMPYRQDRDSERFRRSLPELFHYAHTLLTVSDYLADRLAGLGAPPGKIRMSYPGTVVRQQPSFDDRSGLVFVGRLVEKKGVADLLRAVALLPEPHRSVSISLVGYGPLEAEIRRLASDLDLRVAFLGHRSSEAISATLLRHAIFCGPSHSALDGDSEGLGMVFVEAALAGLPVVAYHHGGVPEVVRHGSTGLLAAEGDVAGLSSHLLTLLADPAKARALGAAAYRRASTMFELKARNVALEHLYDEAAA